MSSYCQASGSVVSYTCRVHRSTHEINYVFKILFKKLLKSQNTAALFHVRVSHFKINYKIVLKAVTPI